MHPAGAQNKSFIANTERVCCYVIEEGKLEGMRKGNGTRWKGKREGILPGGGMLVLGVQ